MLLRIAYTDSGEEEKQEVQFKLFNWLWLIGSRSQVNVILE